MAASAAFVNSMSRSAESRRASNNCSSAALTSPHRAVRPAAMMMMPRHRSLVAPISPVTLAK
jgi:hypothetical protein